MPAWIEVLAIGPPGRGARWREEAIRGMAAIRSSIADALAAIPNGPYAFFDHSVGALVAFEVAGELERPHFDYGKEQGRCLRHTREGPSLAPDEGIALIEALLGTPGLERVVVSATPLQQRILKWARLQDTATIAGQNGKQHELHSSRVLTVAGSGDVADTVRVALEIVLKAYAKVIGPRDLAPNSNFFELGGESLLAAQLVMELRSALPDSDAGIGEIFDFPTPGQLAGYIESVGSSPNRKDDNRTDDNSTDGGRPCARTARSEYGI